MAILRIAGVDMPAPTELSFGIQDLAKAERNTNGNLIAERVNTKRKLEISWAYLSAVDLKTVLSTVQANFFFDVTYIDPLTNASRTGTFYAGDKTAGALKYNNGVPSYKDVKFNLIEK